MSLTPESARRARALRLMREALDISAPDREAWLRRICGNDHALRDEALRLLAVDNEAQGPLDRPLADHLAEDSPTVDPRLGRRVGPYLLRELLGQGGMGSVYRAERDDGGFTQTVALKLLRGSGDDAQARRRFARERQILVRLQHPNIARFLDGGVSDDGAPWYAMELVEGEPITRWAQSRALPLRARLEVAMQVCDAVQVAHRNLVLHRDLKPANILVDAQGQAKLLDFGIAKLLQDDTGGEATRTEHRAYTPDYAAPEQIEGGAVSTATDIYALGVLLYELASGEHPFRRGAMGSVARTPDARPDAPSQAVARRTGVRAARALRGDVDTIVATCLQPDPARRYASAAALRRDLERHLAGLPIEAQADSLRYRIGKFVQRHRLGVVAGALVVVALVAATAISLVQARRAERESLRATALATTLQHERDAALDEVRRQELLREHFVVVLDRATASGEPIAPAQLIELAANPNLLGRFGDARMQSALQLALSDVLVQRGDYPRALTLLDTLEPTLAADDGRAISLAALNRATAEVRIGKIGAAAATIDRADAAMTAEQREGGMLPAWLENLRGQVRRARGDVAGAATSALRSAELTRAARDGSALSRGISLGGNATAMLLVGDLDAAIRLADEADAVWREADVSANVFANTLATQRGNALFLRGDLLAALRAFEGIDANGASESAPSRAARDLSRAKTLALLARPEDAMVALERAVRGMCENVGPDSADCLRVRIGGVDTRSLAGRLPQAQHELDALLPRVSEQAPLLAAAQSFGKMLALRRSPSESTLAAVLQTVPASAAAGALPRRNAVRALLMLAEALDRDGHAAYARQLARAALDTAGEAIDGSGMDRSLLTLWQARLDDKPPPPAALEALTQAIGAEHPLLAAHRPQARPSQ
ncbi:MAG: protein kinase [Chiayiivirga sp.]|uniref:serine/threonine-protein kinase n=1 Tax=Chiayiivirga sp. TaxID=2041042 RepID=UPI0025C2347F|nr:serine/threonine-protein kinase [Chiayiivirga sp.]MCI1711173.1 protein kinase [Chiayiivirga sp.]MCI1728024.1 protein kinase [Chiayiivirga sp.]